MTVTNATIYGNTAIGVGGGIENFGTLALTDTTVSGNTALEGGGIYNQGTVTLGNTIVAGDTATSTGPDFSGGVSSSGYNLIGDTSGSTGWTGDDLLGVNPLLSPLGNYGGLTQKPWPCCRAARQSTPVITLWFPMESNRPARV